MMGGTLTSRLHEALFFYDFCLTFQLEFKHIWSKKLTVANVLIGAMRYITAFGYVITVYLAVTNSIDMVSSVYSLRPPRHS